jgi:hypothetical protein
MTRSYPAVRHAVEAFDKKTEFLVFEVPIPRENIEKLRIIMKWSEPEDEIYGYAVGSFDRHYVLRPEVRFSDRESCKQVIFYSHKKPRPVT